MTSVAGPCLYLYPEEIALRGPEALADLIERLGFGAVSIAVTYHRGRRVFPAHAVVRSLHGGGLAFHPGDGYRMITPQGSSMVDPTHLASFRQVCAERGIGFEAWLVGLYVEDLARLHPDLAVQTVTGDRGSSLCSSHPAVVDYLSDLVADVCDQLRPDAVNIESVVGPGWEPAFTMTLSQQSLDPALARRLAQCSCRACIGLAARAGLNSNWIMDGLRADIVERFDGDTGEADNQWLADLLELRAVGARRVTEAIGAVGSLRGTLVRVLVFGSAEDLRWQGLTAAGVAPGVEVAVGHGGRTGGGLIDHRLETGLLFADRPRGAILSWSESRGPSCVADDVTALRSDGATNLAVYNLSLMSAAAIDGLPALTGAWLGGAGPTGRGGQ